jgi:farnesyl diphosphate synthase
MSNELIAARAHLDAWHAAIQDALDAVMLQATGNERLQAAMQHAILNGGKRMRPQLTLATAYALGQDPMRAMQPALSVELVHGYSLVHDDLPAMDDDALRRGQPTVHIAFDEATAILAGDALQTLAFEVLSASPHDAETRIAMVALLARASGIAGRCGGKMLDLEATGHARSQTLTALETLHAMKTGALIRAAVLMGALSAQASTEDTAQLAVFAERLGLAFQIRDDILDIEADSGTLGKTAGKDVEQGKTTFPALIGMAASKARLGQLQEEMHALLRAFGEAAEPLRCLLTRVVERTH